MFQFFPPQISGAWSITSPQKVHLNHVVYLDIFAHVSYWCQPVQILSGIIWVHVRALTKYTFCYTLLSNIRVETILRLASVYQNQVTGSQNTLTNSDKLT